MAAPSIASQTDESTTRERFSSISATGLSALSASTPGHAEGSGMWSPSPPSSVSLQAVCYAEFDYLKVTVCQLTARLDAQDAVVAGQQAVITQLKKNGDEQKAVIARLWDDKAKQHVVIAQLKEQNAKLETTHTILQDKLKLFGQRISSQANNAGKQGSNTTTPQLSLQDASDGNARTAVHRDHSHIATDIVDRPSPSESFKPMQALPDKALSMSEQSKAMQALCEKLRTLRLEPSVQSSAVDHAEATSDGQTSQPGSKSDAKQQLPRRSIDRHDSAHDGPASDKKCNAFPSADVHGDRNFESHHIDEFGRRQDHNYVGKDATFLRLRSLVGEMTDRADAISREHAATRVAHHDYAISDLGPQLLRLEAEFERMLEGESAPDQLLEHVRKANEVLKAGFSAMSDGNDTEIPEVNALKMRFLSELRLAALDLQSLRKEIEVTAEEQSMKQHAGVDELRRQCKGLSERISEMYKRMKAIRHAQSSTQHDATIEKLHRDHDALSKDVSGLRSMMTQQQATQATTKMQEIAVVVVEAMKQCEAVAAQNAKLQQDLQQQSKIMNNAMAKQNGRLDGHDQVLANLDERATIEHSRVHRCFNKIENLNARLSNMEYY